MPRHDHTDAAAARDLEKHLAGQAAAGTSAVTGTGFDGVETHQDPAQARKALLFFERRAARKSGRRPRVRGIDLRGAF
jgi:hypothetical protein